MLPEFVNARLFVHRFQKHLSHETGENGFGVGRGTAGESAYIGDRDPLLHTSQGEGVRFRGRQVDTQGGLKNTLPFINERFSCQNESECFLCLVVKDFRRYVTELMPVLED